MIGFARIRPGKPPRSSKGRLYPIAMEARDFTARLIIVSNRLPITVKLVRDRIRVVPSAGGLATGLRGPHEHSSGLWVGWPGDVSQLNPEQLATLEERLRALRTVPVTLSPEEVSRFYEGFSNGVLWPLFHYLLDRIPIETRDWDAYRAANERFAEVVAREHRPGDLVWVHDYQLALVPELLRRRIPDARVGFFLHIPFPSPEIFRTLPWRDAILRGLLGADLVGFHTFSYLRHFTTSLRRILGLEAQIDHLSYEGREVRLGVFPMGIDAAEFRALGSDPPVIAKAHAIRTQGENARLLLAVDRLDYTKGILHRLLAIERLLEREPSLRGNVRFVQVAVPSRTGVYAYAKFRRQVDEMVGRINGAYGTVKWTPVQYLFRAVSERYLVSLYRAADVMLVTPLRDGMNLVAKEFAASREDEEGVLVLSEFAGAAAEMGEALMVNPYDIEGVAATIKQALSMPEHERRARMRGLRERVLTYDVRRWADRFLNELACAGSRLPEREAGANDRARLVADLEPRWRGEQDRLLFLDYDGTLVGFAGLPWLATPGGELKRLLAELCAQPRNHVHLVSGRNREWLEDWFGDLAASLHAEHGFWSRRAPGAPWVSIAEVSVDWKTKVRNIFEEFAARTPGVDVEEKTASLAWHYRLADPEFGAWQAKELCEHLANALSNSPVEVLLGDKVIEVRMHGINKGVVAARALAENGGDACVLAMGDDQTDEDMFAALPENAFTVHVGPGASRARYRLPDPSAARAVLRAMLKPNLGGNEAR